MGKRRHPLVCLWWIFAKVTHSGQWVTYSISCIWIHLCNVCYINKKTWVNASTKLDSTKGLFITELLACITLYRFECCCVYPCKYQHVRMCGLMQNSLFFFSPFHLNMPRLFPFRLPSQTFPKRSCWFLANHWFEGGAWKQAEHEKQRQGDNYFYPPFAIMCQ